MRASLIQLPGLALSVAVALLARFAHGFLPEAWGASLSPVLLAVLFGLLLGNAWTLPAVTGHGIRFAFHSVLRLAIVLLGGSLSLSLVLSVGAKALLMVIALMTLALLVAHGLGRALGVPGKLATLLGVGTAVCGNTAISATAPVIGAEDRDISLAIGTNTLFGTIAVFAYPLLGHAFGFGDAVFGSWAGMAVNDTSQVVATGFAYSERAGELATTVKLTRNALMAFVIVGVGFLHRGETTYSGAGFWTQLQKSVPVFVLLFLSLSLLNTLGVVDAVGDAIGRPLAADLKSWAKFLTVVALAGVGLGTKVATVRQTGFKPVLLGLATALCVSLASLALIRLLGPVAG